MSSTGTSDSASRLCERITFQPDAALPPVVVVIVALLGTVWYAASINADRREAARATCERGNQVRDRQSEVLKLIELLALEAGQTDVAAEARHAAAAIVNPDCKEIT